VSDFYDLLGIEAGADKDTIKDAYRDKLDGASQSERAKLNKAWNVLSDPVQRERYDGARAEGWLDDAAPDDDRGVEVVDEPRRIGGRNRPAANARAGRQPARPPLESTVVLPEGMHLAENRARGNALLIDFLMLFVVYVLALGLLFPSLIKSQYPTQSKQIDGINKQITKLDKQKSQQDTIAGDSKRPKAEQAAAKKESKALDQKITKANDQVTKIAKDFQTFVFSLYGVILAVFLLILVPATAMTGQTIGMRFRKVRVVRSDGSPVGWAGALLRFLPPLVLALLIPQLGALLGLGMVLWFFRDRNHQGVHDKLAKTLVVAAD